MPFDQLSGNEGMIERWDEHAKTYDEESKQFSSAVSHFVDWELLKGYLPKNKEARILDAAGGAAWEICSGGVCLQDRNGARLMARYRALLVSQGRPVPLS